MGNSFPPWVTVGVGRDRVGWGGRSVHVSISLTTVSQQEERPIRQILYLGNLLETCHFQSFWVRCTLTRSHPHMCTASYASTQPSKATLILRH